MHLIAVYADGLENPFAFASKAFSTSVKNYAAIEKESPAIVYTVKKFNKYLAGRKFEIEADHQKPSTLSDNSYSRLSIYSSELAKETSKCSILNNTIYKI